MSKDSFYKNRKYILYQSTLLWFQYHFIAWKGQELAGHRQGNYHHQHESCWYAVRKSSNSNWFGDRKQSTLWQINKPRKNETGHSTQKLWNVWKGRLKTVLHRDRQFTILFLVQVLLWLLLRWQVGNASDWNSNHSSVMWLLHAGATLRERILWR